jgi:hypothetical protein
MSRKDFVLIAETIRFMDVDAATRLVIAREFAESLKRTNPRFDADRFVTAATLPIGANR